MLRSTLLAVCGGAVLRVDLRHEIGHGKVEQVVVALQVLPLAVLEAVATVPGKARRAGFSDQNTLNHTET